jgi:hypothetical protein
MSCRDDQADKDEEQHYLEVFVYMYMKYMV